MNTARIAITVAALAVALPGLAGCSSDPAPKVDVALKLVEERAASPSPFDLAVGPLEAVPGLADKPLAKSGGDEEGKNKVYRSPVEPKLADLRAALMLAAKESNAFKDVAFLQRLARFESPDVPPVVADVASPVRAAGDEAKASPGAKPGVETLFKLPKPLPKDEVLLAAFEGRHALALEMRLKKHEVAFTGKRGWVWAANVVNFFLWVFPAWYVADESYEADLEIQVRLTAVGSGKPLFTGPGTEDGWATYAAVGCSRCEEIPDEKGEKCRSCGDPIGKPTMFLDSFERGWSLFGVVLNPGGLEYGNYQEAATHVMPKAVNMIAKRLKKDLAKFREEKIDRDELLTRVGHGQAVVVGCGRYSGRVPDLRTATDDAVAVAKFLIAETPLQPYNVKSLVETNTTKALIKAEVEDRVKRLAATADAKNTFFFYFAGYGFAAVTPEGKDDVFLVTHDFDEKQPLKSSISLSELAQWLDGCKAAQVVILDTSFGGEAAGFEVRTLPKDLLPAAAKVSPEESARRGLESFARDGRTVLCSAKPGSPALHRSPVPEDKKALFTARLLDSVVVQANDLDKDGYVTVEEAFRAAYRDTRRISARAGLTQTPVIFPPLPGETVGASPTAVGGGVRPALPAGAAVRLGKPTKS